MHTMAALRALLASLLILAAGIAVLSLATDGFSAFTTETARRVDIRRHPRALPEVPLQTADGRRVTFDALRGRWVLVDFIYTRCPTYCSVQGSEFARLQERLAAPIARGQVTLLSISFDPEHDDPSRLAAYQRRSGDHGSGWIAARPIASAGLAALSRVFGITAVPAMKAPWRTNSCHWNLPVKRSMKNHWMVRIPKTNWSPTVVSDATG